MKCNWVNLYFLKKYVLLSCQNLIAKFKELVKLKIAKEEGNRI